MRVGAPELAGDEDLVAALNEAAPHGLGNGPPKQLLSAILAAVSNWRYPASMALRQAEVSTSFGGRGIEAVPNPINGILCPELSTTSIVVSRACLSLSEYRYTIGNRDLRKKGGGKILGSRKSVFDP
ncbi:hypothetical protein NL676_021984 [Syzygium grande]|nr:hypothetical protein NL676_021984 [Syzygium grande]